MTRVPRDPITPPAQAANRDSRSLTTPPTPHGSDASLLEVLRVRAFRLYVTGHFVSLCGNAMQQVGIAWLMIELTGSGTALGGVVFMNYVPAFIVGPWGGLLADRVDRRWAVLCTQVMLCASAVTLAVIVLTDAASVFALCAIAFFNGAVLVVDMPLRQVLVHELVSDAGLHRAISVTTSFGHTSRTIGPALAGLLIVEVGLGAVFVINAVTFIAVIISLLLIRPAELHAVPPAPRAPGQLREGVSLITGDAVLRSTFIVLFVVGTLGFSFQVVLPLIANVSFGGDADAYGWMAAAMGVGAVAGALGAGLLPRPGRWRLAAASALYGLSALAVAAMPTLALATVLAAAYGAGNVFFVTTCNVGVQLTVPPTARGRVMAFYGVVFWGSMAIGSPIAGALSDAWGPRAYLAASGLAMLIFGAGVAAVGRIPARIAAGRPLARRIDERLAPP